MNSLRIPDHGIAKLAAAGDEHTGQAREPPCGMDEAVVDPAHTALRVRDGSRTTAARGRCAQRQHERALSRAKSVAGSATGATAHALWFRRARCGRAQRNDTARIQRTKAPACVRSTYLAPRWLATSAALLAPSLLSLRRTGLQRAGRFSAQEGQKDIIQRYRVGCRGPQANHRHCPGNRRLRLRQGLAQ